MLRATNISRDNLLSLGTCFGKFTKTGKVTLHVTCLDYLAQYAEVRTEKRPFDLCVANQCACRTSCGSSPPVR